VLLINNDATINHQGIFALRAAMSHDQGVALVAPTYLDSTGHHPSLLYYQRFFATLSRKKMPGCDEFLSGCCLLLDLHKTGFEPFDERFFMYGEDVALSIRMKRAGHKLVATPAACVEHIGSASSVSGSPFYEYHVARGHLLLTSQLTQSRVASIFLWPLRLTSLFIRSVLRAFRAKSFIPITALWRAILNQGVRK
jgi:N-acetylglucosaminyl-diphospho-decaprenol L-rhamnosyltransferase